MKGLKKLALVSAIAAVSAGAQAELKALDDSTMGQMTGQAGLTIDLQTAVTIGEFAYHDAGYVVLQGISLGGNTIEATNTLLDNIRLEIDVAGSGAAPGGDAFLKYGFSNVKNLAAIHVLNGNKDADMVAAASGSLALAAVGHPSYDGTSTDGAAAGALGIDNEKTYGDGDLKIHFTFTDAWQKGGGFLAYASTAGGVGGTLATVNYATAKDIATRAVDFSFGIDLIGIAASNYVIGSAAIEGTNHVTGQDATDSTTALISNLNLNGYLGPADLHIENNGNGFGGTVGRGAANSKIHWDSYFRITDLDVYIDIAGVQITNMTIHNTRGDLSGLDGTTSFGFAHSKRDIFAVKDAVLNLATLGAPTGTNPPGYVDGIAINTRFKGDKDIGALSFGDTGTSIGSLHWTDITATTNWTISAH